MPYEDAYVKEHIPGANNFLLPKEKMDAWSVEQTGGKSQEDYAALLGEDKKRLIVVYCGFVDCLRSHNGAMWARRLGYENVKRHPGGIYAWKGAGHATESGEPAR
jgi:thiosulfate/3-mercaptopyruvate sulfurtransferase